jgi:hypothetical protein
LTTIIVVSFSYLTQKNYTFKAEQSRQTVDLPPGEKLKL